MSGAATSVQLSGVLGDAQGIINVLSGLFGTSSRPQTDAAVNGWVQTVAADPNLSTLAAQTAMLKMRCAGGDQTVITPQNTQFLFGNGSPSQGCGFETGHGGRQYVQAALTQLATQFTTATIVGQQAAAAMAAINNNTGQNVGTVNPGTVIVPVPGLGPSQSPTVASVVQKRNYMAVVVVVVVFVAFLLFRKR